MNSYVRILFTAATIAMIVLFGRIMQLGFLGWASLFSLGLVYLTLIWVSMAWWTRLKYGLATVLVISLTAGLHFASLTTVASAAGFPAALLLVPLILLLAREQGEARGFTIALAGLGLLAMGLLSPTPSFAWIALPVVFALYMSIRALNLYKASDRLNRESLERLRQTYAELQAATVQSMRYAALAERTRLAREIHDGLGHRLTSLIVQLQTLELMLPGDPERAAQAIKPMLEVSRQAMAEVRLAVETWREDESGLGLAALQGLISQFSTYTPLDLEIESEGEFSEWPVGVSAELYRILQEALTNVLRHAQAQKAYVRIQEKDERVFLSVSDDGRYTGAAGLIPGFGLQGIQERCQSLGGFLRLDQNGPHGLSLEIAIPLKQPDGNQEIIPTAWRNLHG